MKKCIMILLSAVAMISLWACVADESGDIEPRKLVIEGTFDSGGYPDVILTTSIAPSTEETYIADMVVRWGKVTMSFDDTTIVLTGGLSNRHMPPYHYYDYSVAGVPGVKYSIHAEYKGMSADAECVMPVPTPIGDLEVQAVNGSDSLSSLTLHFEAPHDVPAYYQVYSKVHRRDSLFRPSMFGAVEALIPGEKVSVPVYRGHSDVSDEDYVPQFVKGESVSVKLCRVTKDVYEFWKSYHNFAVFGGAIFSGGEEALPTNVAGGYGVWSAQGVDVKNVTIDR